MKYQIHKVVASRILKRLPVGEAAPEVAIGRRIADVVWFKERIIFEVQYSPITLKAAADRCRDYHMMGYHVSWILHDKNFNKEYIPPQEMYLRSVSAYFTDMIISLEGRFYDQKERIEGQHRIKLSNPLEIDLSKPYFKKGKLHFGGYQREKSVLYPV